MIKMAIFDMGGTLVKSAPLYDYLPSLFHEIEKDTLIEYSKNKIMQYIRQNEFVTLRKLFENVLVCISRDFRCNDISKQANELLFKFYFEGSSLQEDATIVLNFFKKNNVKLIIASDADTELLISELKKFNLKKYFNEILISENIGAYKSSEKFNNALRSVLPKKYSKNEIIFVGDAEVDIRSAEQLNITSILVDYNNNGVNFNQDYTINRLNEIISIAKRI